MKRQFNKEEKALALRSKRRMEEEIEHLRWLVEYNELMLEKGYRMNYLEKMRGGKKNKKELEEELKVEEEKLRVLDDQIRNGVEVRKEEENVEDEDERGYVG